MIKYINKLGITCVEAEEGYLLKRGNQTFKKAYLGKNDRAELYEEVIDENYVFIEKEEEFQSQGQDSNNLDDLKKELIKLSKSKLLIYLEDNPLFSTVKYPEGRYYNVNTEHQSRIVSQLLLYQGNTSLGYSYQLTWNDTGNICEDWTFEELFMLSNQISEYIKPIVKKQQQIEIDIKNATTKEELSNIKINYEEVSNENNN